MTNCLFDNNYQEIDKTMCGEEGGSDRANFAISRYLSLPHVRIKLVISSVLFYRY